MPPKRGLTSDAILKLLSGKTGLSISRIAQKTKFSGEAVSQRVREMEKLGLVSTVRDGQNKIVTALSKAETERKAPLLNFMKTHGLREQALQILAVSGNDIAGIAQETNLFPGEISDELENILLRLKVNNLAEAREVFQKETTEEQIEPK